MSMTLYIEVDKLKREELSGLIQKIDGIKQNLDQMKQVLENELSTMHTRGATSRRASSDSAPVNDEELIGSYIDLRKRFTEAGPQSVEEFADKRTVSYLDRFVRVNNIPIPTKKAKREMIEALVNYLARSTLIRGV
jgi:hypothetical protein